MRIPMPLRLGGQAVGRSSRAEENFLTAAFLTLSEFVSKRKPGKMSSEADFAGHRLSDFSENNCSVHFIRQVT